MLASGFVLESSGLALVGIVMAALMVPVVLLVVPLREPGPGHWRLQPATARDEPPERPSADRTSPRATGPARADPAGRVLGATLGPDEIRPLQASRARRPLGPDEIRPY